MADIIQSFPSAGGSASYPEGGATGSALVKKSDANNDVEWKNIDVEKDATPTENSTNAIESGGVYTALADKVDKELGKGLSTNDYDDTEKDKVATIADKADKVAEATEGNFAGLDENGNLTDSGKKASDFATTSDLDSKENVFRLSTMPTASAEYANGKSYQYVGSTTSTYTHNYFYECKAQGTDPETYKWVRTNVQPSSNGMNYKVVTELPTQDIDTETIYALKPSKNEIISDGNARSISLPYGTASVSESYHSSFNIEAGTVLDISVTLSRISAGVPSCRIDIVINGVSTTIANGIKTGTTSTISARYTLNDDFVAERDTFNIVVEHIQWSGGITVDIGKLSILGYVTKKEYDYDYYLNTDGTSDGWEQIALFSDLPQPFTTEQMTNIKSQFHPSNTANVVLALPTGSIITTMGKTAPNGYLVCDGTVYNIEDYQNLADYFTEQFESANYFGGNGTTTFAVPDLRGEFLRGSGTNSHTNQGNGANVGVHQDATTINQMVDLSAIISASNKDSTFSGQQSWSGKENTDSNTRDIFTTRPTNTSVLYSIKY